MSSGNRQPFINSRAFDKASSTYVPFPSRADSLLASLQLFHNVPCRIMDLFCSVVTHPDFDSKQLTLRNSVDVIDVVEEHRLKDRMVVVQKRSASGDGCVEQAGFPQFILDEVLDIIHAKRMTSIKARFEETLDERAMYFNSMHIKEDDTLKAMTVVRRSWTTLAQKALGRVLHIGRPIDEMAVLLSPVRKSIFGPWTSAVAVQFFCPIEQKKTSYCDGCGDWREYRDSTDIQGNRYECADIEDKEECRQWFETLHRILVGFTNLRCLYIKSYASLFTGCFDLTFEEMVRRNVRLKEVTLYAMADSEAFDFDPLIENAALLNDLETLNIRGAWISNVAEGEAKQGPGFARLNNVTIDCFFESLKTDLRLLSILSSQSNSHLESLRINDSYEGRERFGEIIARAFAPSQCASIFEQIRSLHVDSNARADRWLTWISPYCTGLQSIRLAMKISLSPEILDIIPITVCALHLALWTKRDTTAEQFTGWMKCLLRIASSRKLPKLKSFTFKLFVSKDSLLEIRSSEHYRQQMLGISTEMESFKEEMSTVCEGVGIKCNLNIVYEDRVI